LSVKSGGNFEDILAADTPAIWRSNRPAKGGATGKMLEEIIQRAAGLRADRETGKEKGRRKKEKRVLNSDKEEGKRKKEKGKQTKEKIRAGAAKRAERP
jgi:hypothetical protein